MLNRFATLAGVCLLISVGVAPLALADPDDNPDPNAAAQPVQPVDDPGPPPDNGVVASSPPGIVTTPDGWVLTVAATNESELPIAPLTTSAASREYLVAGTFTGTVTGSGRTHLAGGTLEAGYQIGCGIELGQIRLIGSIGGTVGFAPPTGVFSPFQLPLTGTVEIHPKPGSVTVVPVDKKTFKAAPVRVTLKDTHIKIDGCIGQSFLRSYSTLTSSTADTDDVVAYYGTTMSID
jgi:hypothetical protein